MPTEQGLTPATAGGGKTVASSHGFAFPVAVTLVTVAVMVTVIFLAMSHLRERLRAKVMQQDSLVLKAATIAASVEKTGGPAGNDDQLVSLLEASDAVSNIFGVRIFDKNGLFVDAFPKGLLRSQLLPEVLEAVHDGSTFSRFEPARRVAGEFKEGTSTVPEDLISPVLFSTVPIAAANGDVTAIAEFLIDGTHIIGQLREIDREVHQSAILFCSIGGFSILALLSWAFHRLNKANRLLAQRSADLLRANHELTMAAKTSAVGAVAAHLIHGLKNPLFGLQAFVAVKSESDAGGEWKSAIDSAKRMQSMIADVVRIMREESGQSAYEVSIDELVGLIDSKLTRQAKESAVELELNARVEGALPNREANLIILVLTNLIQNAVQASKPGKKITLNVVESDSEADICFDVADEAGGLPAAMKAHLFTPCQSSKAGGTGLGLAISKQLANHLGGKLELVKTDAEGTVFRLAIPRQLFVGKNSKGKLETPEDVVA
jgi:signal transduction histidine kinase